MSHRYGRSNASCIVFMVSSGGRYYDHCCVLAGGDVRAITNISHSLERERTYARVDTYYSIVDTRYAVPFDFIFSCHPSAITVAIIMHPGTCSCGAPPRESSPTMTAATGHNTANRSNKLQSFENAATAGAAAVSSNNHAGQGQATATTA